MYSRQRGEVHIRRSCNKCEGSGKESGWKDDPCYHCDGVGWIEEWVSLRDFALEARGEINE